MATKKPPKSASYVPDTSGNPEDLDEFARRTFWERSPEEIYGPVFDVQAQRDLRNKAAAPTGFLRGAADLGLGAVQGVTALGENLGTLYGLTTGDMDNTLRTGAADATNYLQGLESDTLQARRELAQQAIDAADTQYGKAWEAVKQYVGDPRLLSSELTKQIALMAPGLGAGRLIGGLAKTAEGAATLGTGAAVGIAGIQQGADAASDAYNQALKAGASPDAALAAAKDTFLNSTASSIASQYLIPGGTTIERAIAGRGAALGVSKGLTDRLAAGARGFLGEAAQEGIEEGTGQLFGNIARQNIGQDVGTYEGVGQAAGLGAALGGVLGGPIDLLTHRPEREQPPAPGTTPGAVPGTVPGAGAGAGAGGSGVPPGSGGGGGGGGGPVNLLDPALDTPTFIRRGMSPTDILPTERQQGQLDDLATEADRLRIARENEEGQLESLGREADRLRESRTGRLLGIPQPVEVPPPAPPAVPGMTQVESQFPSALTAPPVPPTIVRTPQDPAGTAVAPGQVLAAPQAPAPQDPREGGPIDFDTQTQVLLGHGPVEAFAQTFQHTLNMYGGDKLPVLGGGVRPAVGSIFLAVNNAKDGDRLRVLANAIDAQETSKNKSAVAVGRFLKSWFEELTGAQYNGNPFPAPGDRDLLGNAPGDTGVVDAAPASPAQPTTPAPRKPVTTQTKGEPHGGQTAGLQPAQPAAQPTGGAAVGPVASAGAGVGADVRPSANAPVDTRAAPAVSVPGRTGEPGPVADGGGGPARSSLDTALPLEERIHLFENRKQGKDGKEVRDGWTVMNGKEPEQWFSTRKDAEIYRRRRIAEETAKQAAQPRVPAAPQSALPTAETVEAPSAVTVVRKGKRVTSPVQVLNREIADLESKIEAETDPQKRAKLREDWANKTTQRDRVRAAAREEAKEEPVANPAERQTLRKESGELPKTVKLRTSGMGLTAAEQRTRRDMEAAERRLLLEANDEESHPPEKIEELNNLAARIRNALSSGEISTDEYNQLGDDVALALGEDEPLFSMRVPSAGDGQLSTQLVTNGLNGALSQIAASSVSPRNQRIASLLRKIGLRTRVFLGRVPAGGLASYRPELGGFELFHYTRNPTVGTAANPFRVIASEEEGSKAGGLGDQWYDVGFYTALLEQDPDRTGKLAGGTNRELLTATGKGLDRTRGAFTSLTYRPPLVENNIVLAKLAAIEPHPTAAWDAMSMAERARVADDFADATKALMDRVGQVRVHLFTGESAVEEADKKLYSGLYKIRVGLRDLLDQLSGFNFASMRMSNAFEHVREIENLIADLRPLFRRTSLVEEELAPVSELFGDIEKEFGVFHQYIVAARPAREEIKKRLKERVDEVKRAARAGGNPTLLKIEFDARPEEILRWDVQLGRPNSDWWTSPFRDQQSPQVRKALVRLGVLEHFNGDVRLTKLARTFISNLPELRALAEKSTQQGGLLYHLVGVTTFTQRIADTLHEMVNKPELRRMTEQQLHDHFSTVPLSVPDPGTTYHEMMEDIQKTARSLMMDENLSNGALGAVLDATGHALGPLGASQYDPRTSLDVKRLASMALRQKGVKGATHYDNFMGGRAMVLYEPSLDAKVVKRKVESPAAARMVNAFGNVYDERRVGMYDPTEDLMVLDPSAVDEQLVLHESTHAATEHKVRLWQEGGDLAPDERAAIDELNQIYLTTKGQLARRGKANLYGFTTLSEFVAEAWSNPEFQAELKALRPDGKQLSLWDRFVRLIRRILGYDAPKSALDTIDARIEQIISAPTLREGKPVFMYAGENALTANTGTLHEAEALALSGVDNESVRLMTGWHRGVDGSWRFEIDDSQATLKVPFDRWLDGGAVFNRTPDTDYKLGDLLEHPSLFAAYPDLADVRVAKVQPLGTYSGWFNADENFIGLAPAQLANPMQVLLHEIQHWVQNKEGFATGGNTGSVDITDAKVLGKARANLKRTVADRFASETYDHISQAMFGKPMRDLGDPAEQLDVIAKRATGKRLAELSEEDRAFWTKDLNRQLSDEMSRIAREYQKATALDKTLEALLSPAFQTKYGQLQAELAAADDAEAEAQAQIAMLNVELNALTKKYQEAWRAATDSKARLDTVTAAAAEKKPLYDALSAERDKVNKASKTRIALKAQLGTLVEDTKKSAVGPTEPYVDVGYALYRLLAGEVESRDTENRMALDAPARAATPPVSAYENILPEEQIIAHNKDVAGSENEKPDVLYSVRSAAVTPASTLTEDLSEKAKEALQSGKTNAKDAFGRAWLSTLPLDRLAADYGDKVRGVRDLVKAIFEKEASSTAKATDVDRWVRQFEQLADRQALEDLLYDANERGVYPHLELTEQEKVVNARISQLMQSEKITKADAKDLVEGFFDDLNARYKRLTPAARDLYETIVKELDARHDSLQRSLERFVTVMEHDDHARQARIRDLKTAFAKARGPYFPVLRFGNYGVAAYDKDGALVEFVLVESAAEQERAATFLKARNPDTNVQRFKQSEVNRLLGGISDSELVTSMQNMVARNVDDTNLRSTLQREMQKVFISALPEYHARQRFLPRRFVPGARRDAPRSFGRAMLSSLRYEAQLRFNPRIQAAMQDLGDFASGKPSRRRAYLVAFQLQNGQTRAELYDSKQAAYSAIGALFDSKELKTYRLATLTDDLHKLRADVNMALGLLSETDRAAAIEPLTERAIAMVSRAIPENTNFARDIETEMRKRMYSLIDSETPATIQFLGNLTYLYHLGVTPSFVLANLSQNPLVTLPVLAAKFGMGRSSRAMWKHAKSVAADMRGPFKAGWRTGSFDIRNLSNVTPEQRRLLEYLLANNSLDLTQSLDLGRAIEGSGKASEVWQKVMRYGTIAGHYSEIFNRVVAALTALELANERAGSKGFETEAARFEYARQVIDRTHLNYSAINRPGIMTRTQLTRLAFQFRTYAFGMTHHILRMFNDAIRGETPEVKAEARRMLFYSVGTGLLAAGLRGLPFYSVYILAAALMGIDDPEREMVDYAAGVLGSREAAEALLRGPLAMAGGDMSIRIGLGSVVPFTNLFSQQSFGPGNNTLQSAVFDAVMGPFGGIAKNALISAPEYLADGDPWRAAEMVAPKVLRDIMQATRWADQGVTTKRGDVIMAADAIGVGDYFWKLAGVQPTEVATLYDERGRMLELKDRVAKGKERYLVRYRAAIMAGDMEEASRVREEATEAAEKSPAMHIRPRQWIDAVKRQNARNLVLESTDGIAATRDERRLLDQLIADAEE